MVDTTITLITPGTRTQDATGVWRKSAQTEREIFARMEDVSRSEFFNGGQAGFRPELKFTVFQAEYQGEAVAEYTFRAPTIWSCICSARLGCIR